MPIQKETACKGKALKNIEYIINPEKTTDEMGFRWVETHNITAGDTAGAEEFYEEFEQINLMHHKNNQYDDRKYYHVMLNFKGAEGITPKKVMDIGRAYIKKFYNDHQVVMAVHIGEDGIHFHACVNSVSLSGKKIKRSNRDLVVRKDFVNDIAYEMYGIEPFDWRAAVAAKRARQKEDIDGGEGKELASEEIDMRRRLDDTGVSAYSWKERIRNAITQAAMHTTNWDEYERYLSVVYGVEIARKEGQTVTYSIKHEGKERRVRGGTLGQYYTKKCILFWLDYNLQRARSETLGAEDPMVPVYTVAVLRDEYIARQNKIRLYTPEGRRRSNLELVFLLAYTILKSRNPQNTVSETRSGAELSFKTPDGGMIYATTDWKIQSLYDSIVYCRDHGFEHIGALHKRHQELQKELVMLRRQEGGLKRNHKKMEPIHTLIQSKNEAEGSRLMQISAALHRKSIHTENDERDFEVRYQSISERLKGLSVDIKKAFSEQKRIERIIEIFSAAQTSMYCYGPDFGVSSPEEAAELLSYAKKQDRVGERGASLEETLRSAEAISREQYEQRIRKNNIVRPKTNNIEDDLE